MRFATAGVNCGKTLQIFAVGKDKGRGLLRALSGFVESDGA
jgi:hypothetical protein